MNIANIRSDDTSCQNKSKYLEHYSAASKLMEPCDVSLINSVISIALNETENSPRVSQEIVRSVFEWEKALTHRETISLEGAKNYFSAYNSLVNKKQTELCKKCKEQNDELMRTTIPISYAVVGSIFLALTCVFFTILAFGISEKAFLINPWYNLMLFIGSLGITVTDIMAVLEWRARFVPKQKKKG